MTWTLLCQLIVLWLDSLCFRLIERCPPLTLHLSAALITAPLPASR